MQTTNGKTVDCKALRADVVMSVDPSINYLGVAVWQKGRLRHYGLVRPAKQSRDDEFQKVWNLYEQLKDLHTKNRVVYTVTEVPSHWHVGGFEARESGSIYKLSMMVGAILAFGQVIAVPPHGWKQQLPKEVVRNRLMPKYPGIVDEDLDHNVMDAIGIGHWALYGKV